MAKLQETITDKKKRGRRIVTILRELYPDAGTALQHHSAWQLLISTILSAQSTDENVNRVTKTLFKKYKKPADFASAPLDRLQEDVRATGFFRQKAKNIQAACKMIVREFDGEVPDCMEDLIRLPGVARKTANVVLGSWFGKSEGVVVDTHVGRLAERLALTWSGRDSKDAVKIEQDLIEIIPPEQWIFVGHALIRHGRKVCTAKKPNCDSCKLAELCPSAFSITKSKTSSRKAPSV